MNSFARSSHHDAIMIAGSVAIDRVIDIDVARSHPGSAVTWHNGLPLNWRNGHPANPEVSTSRSNQLLAKRAIDILVSILALVVLLPLFVAVALCIKATSPGPVLFRQEREGLDGKLFKALKFRSMRLDQCDTSGVAQTVKDDPRVTRIGRFIRRTSIDELPQLLNVLFGDMSLVGPRPHVAGMIAACVPYRALVPYYDQRLAMRPGITGWAQANGYRGMTVDSPSAVGRVDHDLAYIQNFSLLLDLRIMMRTIANEFLTGSGH